MVSTSQAVRIQTVTQAADEARRVDAVRAAGVLSFVLAAQFLTVLMLATSMAPGYDVTGGAISDLGVIPATATLFNLSLLIVGALQLVTGVLLYRAHRRAWLLAVFAVASLGALGAALVPLDRGGLHGVAALVAFLFFNIEAIACTTLVRGPMRVISALSGLVGLAFVGLMVVGDAGDPSVFGAIGHGGAERMIVYPVLLWMIALGGYLMGQRDAPGGAAGFVGAEAGGRRP